MSKPTPRQVFDKLVGIGVSRNLFAAMPDSLKIRLARRGGQEFPESCLPGRVVMALPEEEREALTGLTAEMTQDRADALVTMTAIPPRREGFWSRYN